MCPCSLLRIAETFPEQAFDRFCFTLTVEQLHRRHVFVLLTQLIKLILICCSHLHSFGNIVSVTRIKLFAFGITIVTEHGADHFIIKRCKLVVVTHLEESIFTIFFDGTDCGLAAINRFADSTVHVTRQILLVDAVICTVFFFDKFLHASRDFVVGFTDGITINVVFNFINQCISAFVHLLSKWRRWRVLISKTFGFGSIGMHQIHIVVITTNLKTLQF